MTLDRRATDLRSLQSEGGSSGMKRLCLILATTVSLIVLASASTSPLSSIAAPPQQGTLSGKVTVGPFCPHVTPGNPCLTPPGTYSSRQLVLQPTVGGKRIFIKLRPDGTFQAKVDAGTYNVNLTKCGWFGCKPPNLPRAVTIKPNLTTILNINIDTGIR
jgi:hypothetical protein